MGMLRLDDTRVSWRRVEEDIVAIDLQTSEYITVNAAGRPLWLGLAAGADEDALVSALKSEAQQANIALDDSTARRDVSAFLDSMRTRGLLVES